MTEKAQIGAEGERLAAQWLLEHGFRIVHTNWRHGRYEIDIVAERDGTVHFVEVKCRRESGLTTPEDAITEAKFAALTKAAEAYIDLYDIDSEIQFDLVAVEYTKDHHRVRYIPNAMIFSWG